MELTQQEADDLIASEKYSTRREWVSSPLAAPRTLATKLPFLVWPSRVKQPFSIAKSESFCLRNPAGIFFRRAGIKTLSFWTPQVFKNF
jgi:hypothetical protein